MTQLPKDISLVFLPPAPHTGEFFDAVIDDVGPHSAALSYPGYGNIDAIVDPSIQNYAQALRSYLEDLSDLTLVGFHTGCLVGAELSKLLRDRCKKLILIDVPNFDLATREKFASAMDKSDPNNAAFFAAFDYDCDIHFPSVKVSTTIIGTKSFLFEPSKSAARLIPNAEFIERRDMTKPVFEAHTQAIAGEILKAAAK